MSIVVHSFVFDSANEDKITAHGLTPAKVMEVLERRHLVVRNRRERRAAYLLVGKDRSGSCISVPIEPMPQQGVWRPVTAWPCKIHELRRLEQAKG